MKKKSEVSINRPPIFRAPRSVREEHKRMFPHTWATQRETLAERERDEVFWENLGKSEAAEQRARWQGY